VSKLFFLFGLKILFVNIMFDFLFRGYFEAAPMCVKAIKWLASANYPPSGQDGTGRDRTGQIGRTDRTDRQNGQNKTV